MQNNQPWVWETETCWSCSAPVWGTRHDFVLDVQETRSINHEMVAAAESMVSEHPGDDIAAHLGMLHYFLQLLGRGASGAGMADSALVLAVKRVRHRCGFYRLGANSAGQARSAARMRAEGWAPCLRFNLGTPPTAPSHRRAC